MDAAALRIAEHAAAHGLPSVRVALHGGEPLLAGPGAVELVVTALRAAAPDGVRVDVAVQTNGVLLDEPFLRLLARHRVRVSVSLDGDRAASDSHRLRPGGASSHPDVVRALGLLSAPTYRELFAGLLCTIDLANDPVTTYRELLRYAPPVIDFLLPHANWSRPPPGHAAESAAPYAEWLRPVFDLWYGAPARPVSVRMFEEIIHLLLGGAAATEALGGGRVNFAVIETDGAIETSDSLKTAYHGAASTGLSIRGNALDEALCHPAVAAQQLGLAGLCDTCQACPVLRVCGGGLYAHRYLAGSGFRNPSVYSSDLRALILHIADRLRRDLAPRRVP